MLLDTKGNTQYKNYIIRASNYLLYSSVESIKKNMLQGHRVVQYSYTIHMDFEFKTCQKKLCQLRELIVPINIKFRLKDKVPTL